MNYNTFRTNSSHKYSCRCFGGIPVQGFLQKFSESICQHQFSIFVTKRFRSGLWPKSLDCSSGSAQQWIGRCAVVVSFPFHVQMMNWINSGRRSELSMASQNIWSYNEIKLCSGGWWLLKLTGCLASFSIRHSFVFDNLYFWSTSIKCCMLQIIGDYAKLKY